MPLKKLGKNALIGAIAGAILGIAVTYFDRNIINGIPLEIVLAAAAIGALIGGAIRYSMHEFTQKNASKYIPETSGIDQQKEITEMFLQVREEELDISKERIQTGQVNIHKEIHEEEKTITIPIYREELVIENSILDNNGKIGPDPETIRIPLKEERIEIQKKPVVLNDVSIHKHQLKETETIIENLKKENIHLKALGKAKIIDKTKH